MKSNRKRSKDNSSCDASKSKSTATRKTAGDTIYSCDKCPDQFLSVRALMLHSRSHFKASGVTFTCALCHQEFKTNEDLIEHKAIHEKEGLCFTCEKCKVAFSHHRNYLCHIINHTKTDTYKCIECSCIYYLKRSFKEHIGTHYDRKLKCPHCDQTFKQIKDLQTHKRNYHKTGVLCVECGKMCQSKRDHIEHMITHTGVKLFQCHYCGKGFYRASLRRLHTRKHTNSNPFECPICFQRFHVKAGIKLHLITHDTEKKYHCDFCGREFFHRISIIHHVRMHMDLLLFKCPLCPRKFTTFQDLSDHTQLAHVKKRLFGCKICNSSFVRHRSYTKHLKTKYHMNNAYAAAVNTESNANND